MTDDDDQMMRAAFDPTFKFAPIVKPPETIEATMQAVDASAALVMQTCEHCTLTVGLLELREGRPIAVEQAHEPSCPDYVPE